MPTTGSISNSEFTHREDTAAVSGDVGAAVLGVRNDAAAVVTTTDGDYSQISTDSAGRVGITDLGGSITIDGTVSISGTVTVDNAEFPAASALADNDPNPTTTRIGANNLIWDGANWDRWTGAVTQGTSPWVIGDGGGSITIDGTITADTNFDYAEDSPHTTGEVGAFVLAVRNDANAAMTTTNGDYSPIAVNASGAVAISDGGNSITVDGTVAVTQSTSPWVVSGTVTADTELPAASALADNDPNPTTSRIGANNLIWDGANWDRWTGAVTISGIAGAIATNAERAEDSAHSTGQIGNFILAVRNDTAGTMVDTNGDYAPLQVDSTGFLRTAPEKAGTLANGTQTTVAAAAVSILAANANRKKLIIQNTGAANIRVGIAGVSATTGSRIIPNGTLLFDMPNCPTNEIFAIREGATSSTALCQEVT